ncbi:MAG TPA: fumarylacetoacetate hydrolase family protein, partial [Myxococcota bacterium]|nr:fumarylacetoacetate hydrolase family protein [Myxococcota bacterium]
QAGPRAWDRAREAAERAPQVAPLDGVRLHAPIVPTQIRDFLCFELHLVQAMRQTLRGRMPAWAVSLLERAGVARVPKIWYERPIYYKGNRLALSGPGDEVAWPAMSSFLDYELELGMVLGLPGRDIPEERAREHIFGYLIFNDLTLRDVQAREMGGTFHLGPSKSKDFDGANALGPWLVTADEVGDPYALTMVARVDGEAWSRGSSSTMYWTFEQLIAFVSRGETLHAGELFGSGTVGGGCGLELGRRLRPGATVELEIERLGRLVTHVGPRAG